MHQSKSIGWESHSECDSSRYIKDKDRERGSKHKTIYIGSSYNPGVVQFRCTSWGFLYNHTRLQFLKDIDGQI